jgi:hypothetical protein
MDSGVLNWIRGENEYRNLVHRTNSISGRCQLEHHFCLGICQHAAKVDRIVSGLGYITAIIILLSRSQADILSVLILLPTCIRPVWFCHKSAIPASNTFRSLCSSRPPRDSGATPVTVILTFCRRSKIPRAERSHIAVAQAIERQPRQGEFFRERSKNRFPLGLIRFPRSDVVEAFSRLLVIF